MDWDGQLEGDRPPKPDLKSESENSSGSNKSLKIAITPAKVTLDTLKVNESPISKPKKRKSSKARAITPRTSKRLYDQAV